LGAFKLSIPADELEYLETNLQLSLQDFHHSDSLADMIPHGRHMHSLCRVFL